MKWLLPLGFLGFLGLFVLLIIYLIKPNYQKKGVSSTYVWELSLRFRKKRNPVNRLQNIILLICQIVAISCCAFIMAQPVIEAFRPEEVTQKIVIIDGSASMLAQTDGTTRFERAVQSVRDYAKTVTDDLGEISVIVAGDNAEMISSRTTKETLPTLNDYFDEMEESVTTFCSYGSGDVDGAMKLAEQVLEQTPEADVILYTAKEYIDVGNVEVIDVSDPSEYNVAILNSEALLEENFYNFTVDIASYGRDLDIFVNCEIYGVNYEKDSVAKYSIPVLLEGDEVKTVNFNAETTGSSGIYGYEHVIISVDIEDSFYYDNYFYIYGGTKETIRVQYASSVPNVFFRGSIMSLRDTMRTRWDIEFVEVNTAYKQPETQGFDFYIFERVTPKTMPNDGVVMFVNPLSAPVGIGVDVSEFVRSGNMYLSAAEKHPITEGVIAENIFVSQIRTITFSDDYQILMSCLRDPVYAVRNEEDVKIIVMAFELQNSDVSLTLDFPKLFFQTFNYFFPPTITRNNFEVGESVEVNARAPSLNVSGPGEEFLLEELPSEIRLSVCGTYTLTQKLFTGKTVVENFYVKVPNAESDFATPVDSLTNPYVEAVPEAEDYDVILYLAGALVLLLLLEWWLSRRTQ